MELSAPRGFRWDIWIPSVTAVLVATAFLLCILLQRGSSPHLEKGLTLQRIINADTNEVIADGDLDYVLDMILDAGSADREILSDKLPPLLLEFSDGSSWTIRFTSRGDTVYMKNANTDNWLFSENLSRTLSSIYYASTLPEPTESPQPSASPAP